MKGKRIVVVGLARSGIAVLRAAKSLGAMVRVVDEKQDARFKDRGLVEEARMLADSVELGWTGEIDPSANDFVVTSPGVPKRHPKLQQALADGLEVVSEVEFAYRISKAPIVAITGTNGKSTTAVMTWLCLRAAGEDAVLCGNIAGSGYQEMPLTQAAFESKPEQVLVAEVSSFQLEWISSFRPVAATITNISDDHLDRYDGFEEYAATKRRIFENQTQGDYAVVREGDAHVGTPIGPTVLTIGSDSADAQVKDDGLRLLRSQVPVGSLPFAECHNLTNAAMAALLAYGYLRWRAKPEPEGPTASLLQRAGQGQMPEAVVEGLCAFKGLSHRMERLGERGGVQVINNSMCTNPAAVVASAQSIPQRKHLLLGGSNKKLGFDPLQKYLETSQNRAYLFGRDAGFLNQALGGQWPVFATMEEAFRAAVSAARSGEVVMLAPGCASTDQFEDFRQRGDVFKAIAKEWLEHEG